MRADFEPPESAAPKDGDFARYVEELVNRGQPPASLPPPFRGHAGPSQAAPGAAPPAPGATAPVKSVWPGRGGSRRPAAAAAAPAATADGSVTPAGASSRPVPADSATPSTPWRLPVAVIRLLRLAGITWLVLGGMLNIPPFADSVPFGMILLFGSFLLSPSTPSKR